MSLPAGDTPSLASETPSKGAVAEASRLFGSFSRHFQALIGLAGEEGREAVAVYAKVAIALGAGVALLAFGYVFCILCIAFALATVAKIDWLWIALIFALFHLLGAAGCAIYVKIRYRTPVFRATAEEIKRDIAALRGPQP